MSPLVWSMSDTAVKVALLAPMVQTPRRETFMSMSGLCRRALPPDHQKQPTQRHGRIDNLCP